MSYAKINTRARTLDSSPSYTDAGRHIFYRSHEQEFDYLFGTDPNYSRNRHVSYSSPDGGGKNAVTTEDELNMVFDRIGDSVTFLVGEPGTGKSENLQFVFDYNSPNPKVLDDREAVILPNIFNAQQYNDDWSKEKPKVEDDPAYDEEDRMYDETARNNSTALDAAVAMSSTCQAIMKKYSLFPGGIASPQNTEALWDLICATNSKALQLIPGKAGPETCDKLNYLKLHNPFMYYASLLKLCLIKASGHVARLVVILDGVDTLPRDGRNAIVARFLRLYYCLRNKPSATGRPEVYINLVVAMWPSTYRDLYSKYWFSHFRSFAPVFQENRLTLADYFSKAFDNIPEKYANKSGLDWENTEKVTSILTTKYDGKFSRLIMGLSNNDLRVALDMCRKILSDPVWMTKDHDSPADAKSYYINNISCLRAVGSGTDPCYIGSGNKYIPNILYGRLSERDAFEDNSVLSLYVIRYLIQRKTVSSRGWRKDVTREKVLSAFTDTFGDNIEGFPGFKRRIKETINYLINTHTIAEDDGRLYLTIAGMTLYECLKSDSTLSEMYREDYYQPLAEASDTEEPPRFMSSMDFIEKKMKGAAFEMLYRLQKDIFLGTEQYLIKGILNNGSWSRYVSLFGGSPVVSHLMEGVDASAKFSGTIDMGNIQSARNELLDAIGQIEAWKAEAEDRHGSALP